MQEAKTKYLDYIIKVKGVSLKYAEVSGINIDKVIRYLSDEYGISDRQQVTRDHLDKFQGHIMRQDYAKNTKEGILRVGALFFRYLFDFELIKENIGLIIEPPKKGKHIPRDIMNIDEIKFLYTVPDQETLIGIRDLCIMKSLYGATMRPIELFNLNLEDVDLVRFQGVVKRPKNKHDRVVHFDRYTAGIIKKYLEKVRPWLLKGKESKKVFITEKGTNLSRGSWAAHFSRKYKPIMDEKFKKHITPYCFRHTSATHWLDSGAKQKKDILPFVQRQLGHKSLESTVIYTHVAIEPLRQMFKMYHPREISLKALHKVPTPDEIIAKIKTEEPPPVA